MPNTDDENSINDNISEDAGTEPQESNSGSEDFQDMTDSRNSSEFTNAGKSKNVHTADYSHNEEHTIDSTVTAQPVKFASFEDLDSAHGLANQNLGILLDVKLQLTVELGKTELPIKKVLELTKGSVVTLDKVAGEPVELYANGKLIAHGEVVVIEDNFGLRITHITQPIKRIDTFTHLPHEALQQ